MNRKKPDYNNFLIDYFFVFIIFSMLSALAVIAFG